ncbi:response regulator [Pseudorhodoferax sp. Leaf267]|uniref:Hpt domain-containing response regulator n=1 Tax=Pseudorhodoferax sp. Leaf267 TaxID=1736316 RepID=UPI0006F6F815|nr:response regulator [Pseudorhodoferax sp. Leaf267]KQP13191.1 hypothetical protein ASF43_19000 [Pseudorhodoferax sp. Leaf267]
MHKILLVEDDASTARFVDGALEDLGVDLRTTSSVAQAVAQLSAAPFSLVLTDLMLIGESGRDLVQRLRDHPTLGAGPRVAVYSAGLSAEISAELLRLGAWRLLHKPVPVETLRQCVRDAIATAPAQASAACAHTAEHAAPAAAGSTDVVTTYFGGNLRIYHAYRATCEKQFPVDAAEGDRAIAAGDIQAMRRLAHTLKSVLQALGHGQAAETARAIDAGCATNDWAAVTVRWPALRTLLLAGMQPGS